MSNVGGSANINGILYQILGTLDKAMSLWIEGSVTSGDDIMQARLVVEPAGGGGDLQYGSHSGRIAQQWKAKAKGGTWSLQKIVEEVMPDLYLAVPNDKLDADCRYEFVTEGRRGKWDETYGFFQSLPSPLAPDKILDALPDTPKRHRVGQVSFSDRGLFRRLVEVVRQRGDVGDEPEELTRQKLWHLLQRFVMDSPVNQEQLAARINEFLGHHVEIAEDVDGKRCELCGVLLEVAAEGDRSITAEWLLRKASIPLHSFRDWPRLRNRLRDRLHEQLRKEQYDRPLDVRPSPAIQDEVTIVSGESGQGKTWRLARAASELSEGEPLVVWVPSSRGTADVAEYVAHEIWNYGLERDAQLTLERVAARREQSSSTVKKPWAIVCVDDVRSLEEASFLENLDWSRWGISLAMSTSPDVARSIALSRRRPSLPVNDFDHSELRAYLERRGISWARIARHDVRELIRRPILARVYADIADGESTFKPRTEYDLMEAAWSRISDPTDIGLIRKLAGTIQQQSPTYPWPTEYVLERGGSPDAVKRLIQQGWLQDAGDGNVAMWHHRFLYWAYAKFLVAELNSGKLTIAELGETICRCYRQHPPGRLQLGYVPMDVLWLLLDPKSSGVERSALWQLIVALETHAGMGHEDESLYNHLLASLGERATSLLVDRTRHSGEGVHNAIPRRAAEALLIVGRHHPDIIAEAAKRCLHDGHAPMTELGLRLATAFPGSVAPDRVWGTYRSHIVSESKDGRDYLKRELAATAFRSAAGRHPGWFKEKLNRGDDDDSCFASLVYALGNLGGNDQARKVWSETKEHLFQAIPSHKRRCLIGCIANFNDSDEYRRLEDWAASDEELIGSRSAWALSYRVPERALAVLAKVPVKQLPGTTSHIGRALIPVIPGETCNEVERLIRERPDDAGIYVDILSRHGDRLNRSTVSVLLDWLEDGLRACLDSSSENERAPGRHALDVVVGLHGLNVLAELRQRRGSPLEEHLVALACSRIPKISQWVDRQFEQAREILKRIAGDGFTTLANALISAEHRQLRMEGCEAAVVRPDDETRELLRKEALSDVMWESGTGRINLVQMRAIDSLAALGEGAGLVRGIMKWGLNVSPDIGELREGQSAISDEDLRPALELLNQPDSDRYANAILAIGQSGRVEFQGQIESVLLNSEYDSSVAQASLLALDDLASNCDRILDRLVEQYRSGHHKFAVLKVLGRCGVPDEVYVRLLPEVGGLDDMDQRIVKFLAGDEKTRPAVEHHVRGLIANGGSPLHGTIDLLDPAHDIDRELLWHKSLQPDSGFHTVGSKALAIKALGSVAPDAAFEIGIESLLTDRRDRDTIPHVLMELAPESAIAGLCNVMGATTDKVMCAAVGRAFRESATPTQLRQPLCGLLADANWKCRRAGAFVSGFLEQDALADELLKLAYGDPIWDICAEAQSAIRSHQREAEAAKLAATMNSGEPADVWGAIDCIVQLADPGILVLASDPIGFLESLGAQPFVVRKYASDAIKKRRKQLEKDMTSLHGKWRDED